MFIYAGIDEAGYGPMFGPLVIAKTVFTLHSEPKAALEDSLCLGVDMWALLEPAVCRKAADKQRRIAVDDSKKLYTPAAGLRHIERGVLAFASAAGIDTDDLTRWLHTVGYDDQSRTSPLPWYGMSRDEGTEGRRDEVGKERDEGTEERRDEVKEAEPIPTSSLRSSVPPSLSSSSPPTSLPTSIDPGLLAIARASLTRAMTDAGVRLASISAAVLFEDRFNRMVEATRSKSRCEWTFVAGHLTDIWRQFGLHHPFVVIDRQGGRTHYQPLLVLCFDGAKVRVLDETPDICRYELTQDDHAMTVSFEAGSEERHLPVALASMTAKYTRELLMARFNAFWQSHDPSLKPTAGYVTDGRRFLRDIEPLMRKLNIPHESLIRAR
ncbi:MAG: hypothetical protein WC058_06610 [Phycisphaeraceae bacterium]